MSRAHWLLLCLVGCGASHASLTRTTSVMVDGRATSTAPLSELRHRNHGGLLRLIAVSQQVLDLTPDQRRTLGALRDDVLAKMDPERDAGRELANVLADGVAAGAVDRAKAEAATAKLRAAAAGLHETRIEDLNRLYATLTPQQRTALVAKMQALWGEWQDEWERARLAAPSPPENDMALLTAKLGLSAAQVDRIEARFHAAMQGVVADYDPRGAVARARAFGAAFATDGFDARAVEPAAIAPRAMFGAIRMARFFESFAPELTPDQRKALAEAIREHAARHDSND